MKDHYIHEIYPNGFVRFVSKRFVFIRHRHRWEFYRIKQSAESRGLEMFAGYIEEPTKVAVLERAVRAAWAMGPTENSILPNHSHHGAAELQG